MTLIPAEILGSKPRFANRALEISGRLRGWRFVLLLVLVSLPAGLIAARVQGVNGPWLWNFDMPYLEYSLPTFFREALQQGQLPLWNDRLGLGFPLYAEGQIGAFYVPNWLFYQLPPLVGLDVARVTHLTLLGVGTGLLSLRMSGSRLGAVVAAIAIILCGGVVSKLSWPNFIEGVAWIPWMLIPLVRSPQPTRRGLIAAGITWGIIAIAGHPNVWLLAGMTAAIVMISVRPRLDSLARLLGFGLIGVGVGAIQLIPTAILFTMSVRSGGLQPNDLFASTGMPFDQLGTAFANVFVKAQQPAMDLNATWYPNGGWAPIEIGSYVGLPLLALAAGSLRVWKARPFVAVALFMIAFPLVAGLRPPLWADIPVWNSIHAPVRAYVVLDLALVVLAAMSIGKLQRGSLSWRPGAVIATGFVAAYFVVVGIVFLTPSLFLEIVRDFWFWPPADRAGEILAEARDILSQVWPVALEVALAIAVLGLIWKASVGRARPLLIAGAVVAPLVMLSPPFNQLLREGAFRNANSTLVQAVVAQHPSRVLPIKAPIFWSGMPNQLAVAGVADVEMISSLSLRATNDLQGQLEADSSGALARAVGVNLLITFGSDCPGIVVASSQADNANICRLEGALTSPYWLPDSAVSPIGTQDESILHPPQMHFAPATALALSKPVKVIDWTASGDRLQVDAPSAGWVFVSRAWWPGWQTTVDGIGVTSRGALGGQLIHVAAGRHLISQRLIAWDAVLGLGLGLITILLAGIWALGKIPVRLHRSIATRRPVRAPPNPDSELNA